MDIIKTKHGAGGFKISLTKDKGNTRFGAEKKAAIIQHLNSSWTEGVYITTKGEVIAQLLNGNSETIK